MNEDKLLRALEDLMEAYQELADQANVPLECDAKCCKRCERYHNAKDAIEKSMGSHNG